MRSRLLGTCFLLVVNAGTLASQDTAGVSGCYRFDRAYFQWVHRRPGGLIVIDSTRVLRLAPHTMIRHQLVRGLVLDVHPVPFAVDSSTAQRWLRPSHWTFINRSTLSVVWRNGLHGPVFRLSVGGDSLYGRVRFTTDVVGAEPPAEPASAVRIPCPAQMRAPPNEELKPTATLSSLVEQFTLGAAG